MLVNLDHFPILGLKIKKTCVEYLSGGTFGLGQTRSPRLASKSKGGGLGGGAEGRAVGPPSVEGPELQKIHGIC